MVTEPVAASAADTERVKAALAAALVAAYKGRLKQTELAERLGTTQGRVSSYATGKNMIPIELLPAIEDACERPRGFMLIKAGLVAVPQSTIDMIEVDPHLDDNGRRMLLAAYNALIAHSGD